MRAFRINSTRRVAYAVLFVASLGGPHLALCEGKNDKDKNPTDYLNEFAKRGKAAMDNVDPAFSKKFSTLLPESFIENASKKAHEIFDNGAPGQIGYGFLMGYSSGFCLKKVSKILAFTLGGFFVVIQTLSFNGYMQVNYDKVEQAANKVLDVNKDGKVDMKDAEVAYGKLHDVLSYNMPTGGGFASGLLMGLRS